VAVFCKPKLIPNLTVISCSGGAGVNGWLSGWYKIGFTKFTGILFVVIFTISPWE
jgi:hypothetical protein